MSNDKGGNCHFLWYLPRRVWLIKCAESTLSWHSHPRYFVEQATTVRNKNRGHSQTSLLTTQILVSRTCNLPLWSKGSSRTLSHCVWNNSNAASGSPRLGFDIVVMFYTRMRDFFMINMRNQRKKKEESLPDEHPPPRYMLLSIKHPDDMTWKMDCYNHLPATPYSFRALKLILTLQYTKMQYGAMQGLHRAEHYTFILQDQ